ncbi:phage tail protein [Alcaligenaceae bacterium SJ-26]|nr:phage tail protein [Alcaligenaceae bacterium SJ-26]
MLMALGMFVFSIGTAAYQSLQRQTTWRHAKNSRIGARAGYQYVGPGEDTITLQGWMAPGQVGSASSIGYLRDMGNTGKAFVLVDGLGVFHGIYVITSLDETRTVFDRVGQPRKIEFSLSLERIDEDKADAMLGDLRLPSFGSNGTSSTRDLL